MLACAYGLSMNATRTADSLVSLMTAKGLAEAVGTDQRRAGWQGRELRRSGSKVRRLRRLSFYGLEKPKRFMASGDNRPPFANFGSRLNAVVN